MTQTISILGCGWLGLPFAQYLIDKGWKVKGSTSSSNKLELLRSKGIDPFIININQKETLHNSTFFSSEYLLINIPPSKSSRKANDYLPLIDTIESSDIKKVIFVSSTSVYKANNNTEYEDSTLDVERGTNALLDIEQVFQQASFKTSIVRFGGLVGGVRYPGRFFKAGSIVKGARLPVNLIHLDDCIQILDAIIQQEAWGEIFNGVADTHPTKKTFYSLAIKLSGKQPPQFAEDNTAFKIIANNKIKNRLGIKLKHPDLMAMLENKALWL